MSNDDDNSAEGDSSPGNEPRRMTMMGMGFTPPPLDAAAAPRDDGEDSDGFVDEATAIGAAVIDDEDDIAVRDAVDRAWEDFFPDGPQDHAAGLAEETLPTLDEIEHEAQLARDGADEGSEDPLWDDDLDLDQMSLAEDSLPDSIREPTPTLEDPDELPPTTPNYVGDNQPVADFEATQTEILDSPFQTDPMVAKLVALDGPAEGQEFFAAQLRNTVGRGTQNGIMVPDVAMSRQHFEIVRNPDDSYALVDLQSINGTMLNGTKVREADLFHGDRVEAGTSRFQFVLTGNVAAPPRNRRLIPAATATMGGQLAAPASAAAPSSAAPETMNRIFLGVAIGAVLVSLILFGVVAFLMTREPPTTTQTSSPEAATIYLIGVDAVKAREWDRAQQQFERARAIDPTLQGVDSQLGRIERERKAAAAVAAARDFVDAGEHEEGIEALEEVGQDSVYFDEAQDLTRVARKAAILALYEEAQAAVAADDVDRARELTATLLERVPTHRGALALSERLAIPAEGADAGAEQAVAAAPTGRRPQNDDDWGIELVGSSNAKVSNPSGVAKPNARVPNLTEGFMLYRTRKLDEAEAFFVEAAKDPGPAAASTAKIAAAVKDFRANYAAGVAASESRDWSRAAKALIAAKRADSIVGDYFDADLRKKLATAHAELGAVKLAAGEPVAARKLLQKASGYGESSSVTALERELDKEARSLYVRAQALKKSDPAQAGKLCRQIKAIVPATSEIHQNAAALLKSLPSR